MTQAKLAIYMSWPLAQIENYENGMERIGASRLAALAAALNVEVSYFFEGAPLPEERMPDAPDAAKPIQEDRKGEDRGADLTDLIATFWQIEGPEKRRALLDYAKILARANDG